MSPDSGKEKLGLEILFAAGLDLSRESLSPKALGMLLPTDQVKLCITDDDKLHLWKGKRHADKFRELSHSGVDSVGVLISGNMFHPKNKDTGEVIEEEIHVEFTLPDPAFESGRSKGSANYSVFRTAVAEYLKENVASGHKARWVVNFFDNHPERIDPRTGKPH